MSNITVGFSTSSDWISRAIRWITRSRVSHAWLCLEWYGMLFIIHATVGGVKVTPRSKWESGHNKIVGEFRPKADVTEGVKHALSFLDEEYDYVGILGYIFVVFWKRWFNKKIKNILARPNAMVCSEFLVHLADKGGIPEWRELDPERTTPKDLLEICEKEHSFERVL